MDNWQTNEALDAIAVIGMAGRFPGAKNIDQFWQNLCDGVESITFFSDEELIKAGIEPSLLSQPNYVKANGIVEDIELFDPAFFGLTAKEVEVMDPQHRLFLECAWNALENSGYDPYDYEGSIGIYGGGCLSTYLQQNLLSNGDLLEFMDFDLIQQQDKITQGNDRDYLMTRISYKLGLRGPSVSVNTACSTSIVAVHLACQTLLNYQCDMALAGAVTIQVPQISGYLYREGGIASPNGHCRAFDHQAQGTILGNGVGLVVLKRLDEAIADGDYIYGVIKGSAINNDGTLKVSYTAPSVTGQSTAIAEAQAVAEINPETITYIEAHGTGTALGDPIEITALKQVFQASTDKKGFCAIGSVKPNVGHLNRAAGIAGLVKALLALKYQKIPPSINFDQPNPSIDFQNSPFYVNDTLRDWNPEGIPRRAGISSFGFGGTNAHLVLEEAPPMEPSSPSRAWQLLLLSAKTPTALEGASQKLAAYLKANRDINLGDVAYTLQVGRHRFEQQRIVVCQGLEEAIAALESASEQPVLNHGSIDEPSPITFMFSGQGSQYPNMGLELYQSESVFRAEIDRCAELLKPHLGKDIREIIYPPSGQETTAAKQLTQTSITQPALFVIEYALAKLWQSWGIEPQAMIGHSIGEYVAACLAGVFSLEDALKLVATRGQLMEQLPPGVMLAVPLTPDEIQPFLKEPLCLGVINGVARCVVSGPEEAIKDLEQQLQSQDIEGRILHTSHAFHSGMMEPILEPFTQKVREITLNPPQIPYVSNVTGTWMTADDAVDPTYWAKHLRQTVRFAQGVELLLEQPERVLLEVGPGRTLSTLARQHPSKNQEQRVLTSVRHPKQELSDLAFILDSLGQLWQVGVKIDWTGFYESEKRYRLPLPTYAFDYQRYWVEKVDAPIKKRQFLSNNDNLHPLLGQRLYLARLEEQIRFECLISTSQLTYLKDHCVFSKPVFPATAFLEIALAAGSSLFNSENLILEDVFIQKALILSEDKIKTVQVILTPEEARTYKFQIFSLDLDSNDSEPRWTLHVQGKLLASSKEAELPTKDLTTIKNECKQQISPQDLYKKYQDTGMEYGLSFQAVKQLWHSEGKALGHIELPETLVKEAGKYQLHPVLLDASLQTLVAIAETATEDRSEAKLYLPVNIKRLQVYRGTVSNNVWSQVNISSINAETKTLTGEVSLLDEQGSVIAQLEGLTWLQTSPSALQHIIEPDFDNWLYQIHWQPQSTLPDNPSIDLAKPGSWLLFSPPTGIGKKLALSLTQQGQHCIFVTPGENYRQLESQHYQINPLKISEYKRLLKESLEQQPALRGIVHLWSLDEKIASPTSTQELNKSQELGCGSVLHLVQAIENSQGIENSPLWLITQGSQSVGNDSLALQFQQAPLWGLGRVIAQEYESLQCRCLDLDPTLEDFQAVPVLLQELLCPGDENQIAYRQEVRHVPRLKRQQKDIQSTQVGLKIPSQQPFQLKLSEYGLLENLMLQPIERRSPGPKEVEIQVKAVGLNFRDVLNALGMLKDYYAKHLGITTAEQLTFGFECTGTIVAVGEGISHLRVGNEVMVNLVHDAFSSFITTSADVVTPKPQQMSLVETATIPLAFSTAYHGLCNLAKVRPGDRVLIHAAAGGVGQAAVQLAQQAGAEVFATASPRKWEFLKSMGVNHVMNSRTLDFAEEVMNLTQGKGVDVVLNSLNGEFITKNFEILATGGRFVEIGKIGIWDENQVKQKRPDAQYFPFDLGNLPQDNPGLIGNIMDSLGQKFEQGFLKPLPHKVFKLEKVVEAFRYMQQSKHIGKIVISMPQAIEKQVSIKPDGSYLITGGLGALGLKTAKWIVEQGAKNLVLTGRRQPSTEAQQTIEQLQEAGVQVLVLSGDVSQEEDVARIIEKITTSLPPLQGLIHLAGVLDDGLISNMSWEQFTRVMSPKVQGAWHLHCLTENLPLDFFVCYSSIASLLGLPGQGNYAAANAFMDALAHYRQGIGLPGLSINWGPWGEVGMAAKLDQQKANSMAAKGISPISLDGGLQMLGQLISQGVTQMGVMTIDWTKFLDQFPAGACPPLLSELAQQVKQQQQSSPVAQSLDPALLRTKIKEVTSENRQQLLINYLQNLVSKFLGLPPSNLPNPNEALNSIGLDSLVSIQLRNRLRTDLEIELPMNKLSVDTTITKIVSALQEQLLLGDLLTSETSLLDEQEEEEMEEFTL